MLLAGAGLLLRSFVRLRGVPLGFAPDHLLTLPIAWPETKYPTKAQVQSFYSDLLERTQSLAAVKSATAATSLPLMGEWDIIVTPENRVDTGKKSLTTAFFAGVTPSFHRTLGIQLVKGRLFTDADNERSPAAAIVQRIHGSPLLARSRSPWKAVQVGTAGIKRSWITVVEGGG